MVTEIIFNIRLGLGELFLNSVTMLSIKLSKVFYSLSKNESKLDGLYLKYICSMTISYSQF